MEMFGSEGCRLTTVREDGLVVCNTGEADSRCHSTADCVFCPRFQAVLDKLWLFESTEETCWMPVSEKPKDSLLKLVYLRRKIDGCVMYSTAIYLSEEDRWVWPDTSAIEADVVCWMNIPTPPEIED